MLLVKLHFTEILILDNSLKARRSGRQLRRALIESGRNYKCENCGITHWDGKKLLLQVHHKDKNWRNNLADNLQILCPNCHSQTDTFLNQRVSKLWTCRCGEWKHRGSKQCKKCGARDRNIKLKKLSRKPPKDELENLIWKYPSTYIANLYGVSDKAIYKWCKTYGLTKPSRGYWSKGQLV